MKEIKKNLEPGNTTKIFVPPKDEKLAELSITIKEENELLRFTSQKRQN